MVMCAVLFAPANGGFAQDSLFGRIKNLSGSECVGYTGLAVLGLVGGAFSAMSIPFTGALGVAGAVAGIGAIDLAADKLFGVSIEKFIGEKFKKDPPPDTDSIPTDIDERMARNLGNGVRKEKKPKKKRQTKKSCGNQRNVQRRSGDEDDELSPDQIPDPDNDDYVWCEDVCGEEGMRPVCPADTSSCVFWGCSRCGHVIRRKARIAKRKEREWTDQGKDCHWHGTQMDIRQAKSAD